MARVTPDDHLIKISQLSKQLRDFECRIELVKAALRHIKSTLVYLHNDVAMTDIKNGEKDQPDDAVTTSISVIESCMEVI